MDVLLEGMSLATRHHYFCPQVFIKLMTTLGSCNNFGILNLIVFSFVVSLGCVDVI